MTHPQNPYRAGNPISDQDRFIGRADVMRETLRVLRNPNANAIVLHGQRRIGKTSILLRLEKDLTQDEYCPVYFDLQDKAAMPLGAVLCQLAQTIGSTATMQCLDRAHFDDGGAFFRTKFLPAATKVTVPRILVLLFDEFDVLDLPHEGQAGSAFFPYLRAWMARGKGSSLFCVGAVLTKQERARLNSAARRLLQPISRGAATLIEAFVKGLGDSLGKSMVT